jgi:hypothetical protein
MAETMIEVQMGFELFEWYGETAFSVVRLVCQVHHEEDAGRKADEMQHRPA